MQGDFTLFCVLPTEVHLTLEFMFFNVIWPIVLRIKAFTWALDNTTAVSTKYFMKVTCASNRSHETADANYQQQSVHNLTEQEDWPLKQEASNKLRNYREDIAVVNAEGH